ncbi:hypothetical protein [Kribbella sp. NPDC004536]|uniref:hypothetical protein n=1 Tax=Kribbella sp. NPDC004536 TaxID=3364106 RepID=UPI0036C8D928
MEAYRRPPTVVNGSVDRRAGDRDAGSTGRRPAAHGPDLHDLIVDDATDNFRTAAEPGCQGA